MSSTVADLNSALGRSPDPPPRWARWFGIGIWLVYLYNPLGRLLDRDFDWQQVLGLVALAAFAVTYLSGLATSAWGGEGNAAVVWPARKQWSYVGLMLVLVGLVIPGAGDASLTAMVFVVAGAVAVLPLRAGIAVAVVLFVATEAARLVPGWSDDGNGLAVILAGFAVIAFKVAGQRRDELVRAERELGELALKQERSRIARDLHDILGHTLTVLTVKAELASRLLDVDVERSRRELSDIQGLTRDALADVRATALGERGVSLPAEIAAARSALDAAGIEADLPTVTEEVPSRRRELFAWTVREGVTNVLRHSTATRCEVRIDPATVEILDNGGRRVGSTVGGHGLDGLRERAESAGGQVSAGPRQDGAGFRLHLVVPR